MPAPKTFRHSWQHATSMSARHQGSRACLSTRPGAAHSMRSSTCKTNKPCTLPPSPLSLDALVSDRDASETSLSFTLAASPLVRARLGDASRALSLDTDRFPRPRSRDRFLSRDLDLGLDLDLRLLRSLDLDLRLSRDLDRDRLRSRSFDLHGMCVRMCAVLVCLVATSFEFV